MQPVRPATLTEDVYSSLQTLIMDHEIAPGDRLNIDALARQLAVSPTPVRGGLARPESDGRVRIHLPLSRMDFPASHGGISGAEHARVVRAIASGDPGLAAQAMESPLTAARARHLPFFHAQETRSADHEGNTA